MALALEPKLLLLDEPMAGMGPEESLKVVELLQQLKGKITMLLIEHDMDAVFSVADRVSVLVYGHVIATGTPSETEKIKKFVVFIWVSMKSLLQIENLQGLWKVSGSLWSKSRSIFWNCGIPSWT